MRVPVENYFRGQATGDGKYIKKAFFPDARMVNIRNGKLSVTPVAEFIARFNGKPADGEAQRTRHIESVSVTGDAAVVKITLDYPNI